MLSAKRKKENALSNDRGAAVVEFALTLLFLFFFFIAFMQIVQIVVGHERLSFASFVASRTYSVHGEANATNAANSIESGVNVKIEDDGEYKSEAIKSGRVTLVKRIDVPIDFRNIRSRGGTKFTISTEVKTFRELPAFARRGDN